MDILIKNVELPKNCNKCFYVNHCESHAIKMGELLRSGCENFIAEFRKGKLEGCPLIEVTTHGELIDKYQLRNSLENKYCEGCLLNACDGRCTVEKMLDDIDGFTTILEAST